MEQTSIRKRLGDFQLDRELGRGGMGIVYEAVQVSLNRKVALKVLSGALGITTKAVVRFKREAESAARLHHTNIVPIYATGESEGCHYYAMELIEGPGLDQVIARLRDEAPRPAATDLEATATMSEPLHATPPSVTSAPADALSSASSQAGSGYFDTMARMMAEVADALGYAHDQGVVHRDIKPSNLLLGPQGRLSMNDFGLARVLEEPGMTTSGEFIGSPLYMSPEQITAGRAPLDHRTDIYSLGATLYELLTLRPPFLAERRDQVIAQIMHKEPKRPRSLDRRIPLDLETICLKAMEKDPDKRYGRAGDMAEDLRRFVNRFAISARRVGPIGRLTRWARRNRSVAAALAAVVVVAVAAGLFAYANYLSGRHLREMRLQAAMERALIVTMNGQWADADAAFDQAEQAGAPAWWTKMLRGQAAMEAGDGERAVAELKQVVELNPQSVAARALLSYAYMVAGDWVAARQIYDQIATEEPQTAEDWLFKGRVQASYDPQQALLCLNEAVRLRPTSPVALLTRARARMSRASDTGNSEEASAAAMDALAALRFLPGEHPVDRARIAIVLIGSAAVHRANGDLSRSQANLESAREVLESAKEHADHNAIMSARLMYLEAAGDAPGHLALARRACETLPDPWFAAVLSLRLYEQGRFAEVLDTRKLLAGQKQDDTYEAMIALALLELPGQRGEVEEMLRKRRASPRVGALAVDDLTALLLMGERQRAAEQARWRREQPWFRVDRHGKFLDFYAGSLTEEQFIREMGNSRWHQCEGHYGIALCRLAAGDREGAREHFRKAADTGLITFMEYYLSLAFLKRLDDPRWPRCIVERGGATGVGVTR